MSTKQKNHKYFVSDCSTTSCYSNRTLTAKFHISAKHRVTVLSSVGGSTSPTGTIEVADGEYVDFTASPNSGFKFDRWEIVSGNMAFWDERELYEESARADIFSDCTIKAHFVSSLTDNPISVSSAKYNPLVNGVRKGIEITVTSKYPLKKNITVDLVGNGMYQYIRDEHGEQNTITDSWSEMLENVVLTSGKSTWRFTLLPSWPGEDASFRIFNSSVSLHLFSNDSDDSYRYVGGNTICTITY